MKAKSFQKMGDSAFRSLQRFPLVIAVAVVAAIAAINLTNDPDSPPVLLRLLMCSQLAIPLLLATALAAERFSLSSAAKRNAILGALIPVLVLVIYYFTIPEKIAEADIVRFTQWNIAAHLFVAFLPYLKPGETHGFWQYNLTLALRLLNSLFFTVVLFAGLSVALAALDTLFNVDLDEKIYLHVWIVLAFVFNTWYYLGGVPTAWHELEQSTSFPKIVQVFGQHILAPLVIVYQTILLVYLVKIIATSVWPSSWIGWLVSSVAIAGLLSLLLIHPKTESRASRWLRIYGRVFHVALIPAVIMLLMAVSKRIGQYGITEMRYLLFVLALWLGVIAVLGAIRGRISIKTIPASLLLLAVVTAWGPLGASTISRRSQLARLDSLLTANSRLVDGVITTSEKKVWLKDNEEITGALRYLFNYHGLKVLESRCDSTLLGQLTVDYAGTQSRKTKSRIMSRTVADHLNLPPLQRLGALRHSQLVFQCDEPAYPIGIRGYDFSVPLDMRTDFRQAVVFEGDEYVFTRTSDSMVIVLTRNGVEVVRIYLAPMLLALRDYPRTNYTVLVPGEMLQFETYGDAVSVKLAFSSLVVPDTEDRVEIVKMVGAVFVRVEG